MYPPLPPNPPNSMNSIFLAHPSSASTADIADWSALIADLTSGVVTPARDSMRNHMGAVGGWEAWYRWVATGRDIMGAPVYSMMVCPKQWVGKRTHRLVEEFLTAQKPVYFLDGGELTAVCDVQVDPDAALDDKGEPVSWTSSWVLCPAGFSPGAGPSTPTVAPVVWPTTGTL